MKRKSSGGPPPPHAAAAAIQEQRRRSSGVQVTQQPTAAHGAIAPSPTTSPEGVKSSLHLNEFLDIRNLLLYTHTH